MKKHFSIWDALRFGFSTTINHFLFFLGIFAFWLALMAGVGALISLPFLWFIKSLSPQAFSFFLEAKNAITPNKAVSYSAMHMLSAFQLSIITLLGVAALAVQAVSLFLTLGFVKVGLDFYDHHTSTWRNFLSQFYLIPKGLVVSLLYVLIVGFGFMLLVIPGIIWGIQFGFFLQALIDKKTGIIDSLKLSSKITRGARLNLFGLHAVLFVINALGLAAAGIGLLLTVPASFLAVVYAYRTLEAQTPASKPAYYPNYESQS